MAKGKGRKPSKRRLTDLSRFNPPTPILDPYHARKRNEQIAKARAAVVEKKLRNLRKGKKAPPKPIKVTPVDKRGPTAATKLIAGYLRTIGSWESELEDGKGFWGWVSSHRLLSGDVSFEGLSRITKLMEMDSRLVAAWGKRRIQIHTRAIDPNRKRRKKEVMEWALSNGMEWGIAIAQATDSLERFARKYAETRAIEFIVWATLG